MQPVFRVLSVGPKHRVKRGAGKHHHGPPARRKTADEAMGRCRWARSRRRAQTVKTFGRSPGGSVDELELDGVAALLTGGRVVHDADLVTLEGAQ